MTSIGDRLRSQRLQNRISLEKVSLDTKIGIRLLEAIEAEQFEKLPGGVFRRSFVLQYARALGIDPDEIADELNQLTKFDDVPALPTPEMLRGIDPAARSGSSFREGFSGLGGSTIGSLLAAVGVIMACALVYSWWQTPHQAPPAPKTETVAPKPVLEAAPPEQPAPTPASTPEPTPEAAVPAVDGAPVRVALSAGERTWISISSDGKHVLSIALEPNETKVVEASEKVLLYIGNAGGVEISLNGKPIGPVGPRGQVRVVELTQAGFQIARPKPNLAPL